MEPKKGNGIVYFFLVVILIGILSMCGTSGSDSSNDRKCAWCNGTGYSGNGATNATEYVFKKTPCKHCGGDGRY